MSHNNAEYESERLAELCKVGIFKVELPKPTTMESESFWSQVNSLLWNRMYEYRINQLNPRIGNEREYFYIRMEDLITSVGYELVNKSGKLNKRISSYMYKTYGLKLSDKDVSELGNMIYKFTASEQSSLVDLTQDFDWDDGQFGHDGSCYWGDYAESRDMIESANGFCLRYYESMEDDNGIGRTWIIPMSDNQSIVIFNAYGCRLEQSAAILAKLLATDDTPYVWNRLNLHNHHDSCRPYINSNLGIVVTPKGSQLDGISSYDINLRIVQGKFYDMCNEDRYICENCGNGVNEDDVCFNSDGEAYCRDCYNELYYNCEHCGREVYREDGTYYNDYVYCTRCADRYLIPCDRCGETLHVQYDNIITYNEDHYCESCADRMDIAMCDGCNEYFDSCDLTEHEHEYFCDDCLPESANEVLESSTD